MMADAKSNMEVLFSDLPWEEILDAYEKAGGNELPGNFTSPESSAALVANMFGFFLHRADELPPLPGTEGLGWPAQSLALEQEMRFPWPCGKHPWLDVLVETKTHLIGIESKRYEPFRGGKAGTFRKTYWRDVWGKRMQPYEDIRDALHKGSLIFKHLDAAQLVKHAFGLRTQGERRGKKPALVYLYAEPRRWGDGRAVNPGPIETHRQEVKQFARRAVGAELSFHSCDYQSLLDSFLQLSTPNLRFHADRIASRFLPR